MMNSKFRYLFALAAVPVLFLSGCLNIEVPLPPVTLDLPLGNDLVFGIGAKTADDKFTVDFPEACDLPDLAELEAQVREALGPISGILDIESVSLEEATFTAQSGNFDFIDFIEFSATSGDQSFSVSADLAGQTNVTSFVLTPEEPIEILDIFPSAGECVQGSITYEGQLLPAPVVYDVRLKVVIRGVARI
jgi:hypothetical protein